MHEEGNYKGCVEMLIYGLSGKKGTEQMEFRFFIDENTRNSAFLYFTPTTEDKSMEILNMLGFNGDFKAPVINEIYYKDYELDVYCKHEEYQGETKERWNIGSGGGKPAPDDIAARRSAEFRARFSRTAPPAKRETPAESAERAPAPKAPPPKRAPAKPTTPAYGKEDAFYDISKQLGEVGVDTDEWNKAIDLVGNDEDEFTAEQWKQVVRNYLVDACPF